MQDSDVEKRLANLEKECRCWKRAAVTAIILSIAMLAFGTHWGESKAASAQEESKPSSVKPAQSVKPDQTRGGKKWKLLHTPNLSELQQYVENDMAQGWEPCGGVSTCYAPDRGNLIYYTQAMWKR